MTKTTPRNVPVNEPTKAQIKKPTNFVKQDVDLAKTPLFFPEGFEKIFIAIYFISLPYVAGLLFLFFYVAEAKIDLFLSLNDNSFFILTWAIGYQIIASLILLYIMKMAISFANANRRKGPTRRFKRP